MALRPSDFRLLLRSISGLKKHPSGLNLRGFHVRERERPGILLPKAFCRLIRSDDFFVQKADSS
jgi:hypothetical protein